MTRAEYEALRTTPAARELREAAVAWSRFAGSPEDRRPDMRLLRAALSLAGEITGPADEVRS